MNPHDSSTAPHAAPARLVLLLALACGAIVANLYYAQPLIAAIAPDVGLPPAAASLIVTLTQLGYCAGLILLVPLGDLLENRRLICVTLLVTIAMVVLAAAARSPAMFLLAAFGVGLSSVVVQMLVPMAAHLSPEATRGRTVGNVMSGLLVGIMLARPVASLIAGSWGWRAVFTLSALLMLALCGVLWRRLPERKPAADHGYGELIGSLGKLWVDTPVLRRRAAYQAAVFAAFSLYWTAVPLLLVGPKFNLSQHGVAWFTLAGVAGALAAPVAGRLADRGHGTLASGLAMGLVLLSFGIGWFGVQGSLVALLAAGILLDLGVQSNMVVSQRAIYSLGAHARARLNAVYMATFFAGGAAGSAIASVAFQRGGWPLVSAIGAAFAAAALAYFATERREVRTAAAA